MVGLSLSPWFTLRTKSVEERKYLIIYYSKNKETIDKGEKMIRPKLGYEKVQTIFQTLV